MYNNKYSFEGDLFKKILKILLVNYALVLVDTVLIAYFGHLFFFRLS